MPAAAVNIFQSKCYPSHALAAVKLRRVLILKTLDRSLLNFRVDLNLADPPYCEMNKTSHLTFKKRNFLIEHATRHNLIRFEGKHMKSGRVDHVFCLS